MMNFELSFKWAAVQSSKNALYSFPDPVSKYLRSEYKRPAIYRWLVSGASKTSIYIGETENLQRRLYHYLNPGPSQKTNARLKDYLDKEMRLGASVELDVLSFEPFAINGREYSLGSLCDNSVRCFLESLLITQLPLDIEKLNRLTSLQEKVILRAVKTLRPDLESERLREIIGPVVKANRYARTLVLKGHGFSRAVQRSRRRGL